MAGGWTVSRVGVLTPKHATVSQVDAFPEVLTAAEAAELLRISLRTVYRMCRMGEIPHRRIGESLRFSRRQLLEWLEGR